MKYINYRSIVLSKTNGRNIHTVLGHLACIINALYMKMNKDSYNEKVTNWADKTIEEMQELIFKETGVFKEDIDAMTKEEYDYYRNRKWKTNKEIRDDRYKFYKSKGWDDEKINRFLKRLEKFDKKDFE